jgi:sulfur carrier protein
MQVLVNGELRELSDDLTVAELVEELGFAGRRIAVEVNLEIVPRSSYQEHRLKEADRVEVVQAIGGG